MDKIYEVIIWIVAMIVIVLSCFLIYMNYEPSGSDELIDDTKKQNIVDLDVGECVELKSGRTACVIAKNTTLSAGGIAEEDLNREILSKKKNSNSKSKRGDSSDGVIKISEDTLLNDAENYNNSNC